MEKLPHSIEKEYIKYGPRCKMVNSKIQNISDYLAVFGSMLGDDHTFWFRGHADLRWKLRPSALRFGDPSKRNKALDLLSSFKLLTEIKLEKPPGPDEELKWIQLAQHYGLPTRLLDWTKNAAISLYFACLKSQKNGMVFVFNPVDLNREVEPKRPRIFDFNNDSDIIEPYLELTGEYDPKNGRKAIAIQPVWNSERIMLQQGVFTLFGSKYFKLSEDHAPSLIYVPILKEFKKNLLKELERIGVSEMSIFPEPEHICKFLKRNSNLGKKGSS